MHQRPNAFPKPWDHREPIIDALARFGLHEHFREAVNEGNRELAVADLCEVGADMETAGDIVAFLLQPLDDGR
jgi:hypothetical protein